MENPIPRKINSNPGIKFKSYKNFHFHSIFRHGKRCVAGDFAFLVFDLFHSGDVVLYHAVLAEKRLGRRSH